MFGEIPVKILVIGHSGVGKTSIVKRFLTGEFSKLPATVGMDFKAKSFDIDGQVIRVSIFDTVGAEKFLALTPCFYRGAQGVVMVYDLTSKKSFEALDYWMGELDDHGTRKDTCKALIANKLDLDDREVSCEDGLQYAMRHEMLFTEASAKDDYDNRISDMFDTLVRKILDREDLLVPEPGEPGEDFIKLGPVYSLPHRALTRWFVYCKERISNLFSCN